jgi:hypothetical protein
MSPQSPKDKKEEEYFLKIEAEKLRKLAETQRQSKAADELKKLKELHWMRCPKCGAYRGIKIDKCFSCGGVYLDDGELELVAAREASGILSGLTKILGGG